MVGTAAEEDGTAPAEEPEAETAVAVAERGAAELVGVGVVDIVLGRKTA